LHFTGLSDQNRKIEKSTQKQKSDTNNTSSPKKKHQQINIVSAVFVVGSSRSGIQKRPYKFIQCILAQTSRGTANKTKNGRSCGDVTTNSAVIRIGKQTIALQNKYIPRNMLIIFV